MKLARRFLILLAVTAISCVASLVAYFLKQPRLGMWVIAPVLLFWGWAFVGHLVTLDEDAPGGWSNPSESKALWYWSIGELLVKLIIFIAVLSFFFLNAEKTTV